MKLFLQMSVIIKGLSSFTQEICMSLARKKGSNYILPLSYTFFES